MDGRSCTVLLIGSGTADRKWINYEIVRTWDDKKGIVGVYVHNLQDRDKKLSIKGKNPFDFIGYGKTGKLLSSIVKAYDPPGSTSKDVYDYISKHLADWIDEAIKIRDKN